MSAAQMAGMSGGYKGGDAGPATSGSQVGASGVGGNTLGGISFGMGAKEWLAIGAVVLVGLVVWKKL